MVLYFVPTPFCAKLWFGLVLVIYTVIGKNGYSNNYYLILVK